MKQKEEEKLKMLFGIKEGRKSFKLYKVSENEFLIIEKRYLMNFFLTRKTLKFNNKDQAEDYIIHNTKKFHVIST
jgi:hypothetical protein